jgi:lipoprotein-anchoring transpeptidase ErfK/SrfK
MLRTRFAIAAAFLVVAVLPRAADASVVAKISLSSQKMEVFIDGQRRHVWPVSTARRGYVTPTGQFRPYWLSKDHRSSRYDDAPMPYAVFFRGNYAIHGTAATGHLGRPASHGCVRLRTANAATLYRLVSERGKEKTKIIIGQ